MTVHVGLTTEPIGLAALIEVVQTAQTGGIATFIGVVRDHSDGGRVLGLDYEAYEPMAELALRRIAESALARHRLLGIAIAHRTGTLAVGDTSVAIVTASVHRAPALAACAEAIEHLKRDVPIWKREHHPDGARWVDARHTAQP